MKFIFGEIIPDAGFRPAAEPGWKHVKRPGSMWLIQLAAFPVGIASAGLVFMAWKKLAAPAAPDLVLAMLRLLRSQAAVVLGGVPGLHSAVVLYLAGAGLAVLATAAMMLLAAIPLALYFMAHEFVHALAAPGFGLTERSVVGVWPAGGVAYAYYEGEMSRERLIVVLLMPFTLLSLLPLAVAAVFGFNLPILAAISVINALGSYVDLFNAADFFIRIPRGARVRLAGDGMWFKPPGKP